MALATAAPRLTTVLRLVSSVSVSRLVVLPLPVVLGGLGVVPRLLDALTLALAFALALRLRLGLEGRDMVISYEGRSSVRGVCAAGVRTAVL